MVTEFSTAVRLAPPEHVGAAQNYGVQMALFP